MRIPGVSRLRRDRHSPVPFLRPLLPALPAPAKVTAAGTENPRSTGDLVSFPPGGSLIVGAVLTEPKSRRAARCNANFVTFANISGTCWLPPALSLPFSFVSLPQPIVYLRVVNATA
jgi:hypothetical protein